MIAWARVLLTITAVQYGAIPLVVDLSESHVFNSGWPPHARFHMVWLLTTGAALAIYQLVLVWGPTLERRASLRRAACVGAFPLLGFFVACATQEFFGASLADPAHRHVVVGVEGNLFSFVVAATLQAVAYGLARFTKPAPPHRALASTSP